MLEWYGATSEVPWLFLLAAWVLALLVASAAYALWNRAGLALHLAVRQSRPGAGSPRDELSEHVLRASPYDPPIFEGDSVEVEVGLRTAGATKGPAWVAGRIAGDTVTFGTGVVTKAGWSRTLALPEVPRGPLDATGWTVRTSDPLGLFVGTRPRPDSEVALVLPRFMSLASRRESRELEASVAAPRAGMGNELFGIREYRPGDSLRRIHWRSSARRGELVVREYEPPGVQTLTVMVDPSPPSREAGDQIARIAASEAWDCIREGGRVTLWAPGMERSELPRDIWSQLEWLARYPDGPSGPPGHLPTKGEEVVVVTATANPELLDAAEKAARGRMWVVGDAAVDSDIQCERVGTAWPL